MTRVAPIVLAALMLTGCAGYQWVPVADKCWQYRHLTDVKATPGPTAGLCQQGVTIVDGGAFKLKH